MAKRKARSKAKPEPESKHLLLRELMSRNVVAADPGDTLRAAARRMRRHAIGCLVVIEQKRLIGILTERDVIGAVAQGKDPSKCLVEDLMSQPVVCAAPDVDVAAAAKLLLEHNIKKLPLLGEDGQVEGIVTFTDFATVLPAFQDAFSEAMQTAGTDAKARFGKQVAPAPWTFI